MAKKMNAQNAAVNVWKVEDLIRRYDQLNIEEREFFRREKFLRSEFEIPNWWVTK